MPNAKPTPPFRPQAGAWDFLILRHGPTSWNAEGRIQGHSDIPLSPAGRSWVASWQLPDWAASWPIWASPLGRAVETAQLVNRSAQPIRHDARLKETHYGQWEGRLLAELRAEGGAAMAAEEARGRQMQPPGGESPIALWQRVWPALHDLAQDQQPKTIVCHNGVIRILYAIASGWDMVSKPPHKLRDGHAHYFRLIPGPSSRDNAGAGWPFVLQALQLNIALTNQPKPGS